MREAPRPRSGRGARCAAGAAAQPEDNTEGLTRIELASSVWKTEALPLSYSPEFGGFPPVFAPIAQRNACSKALGGSPARLG